MNSENSKNSKPDVLIFKTLTIKQIQEEVRKKLLYQILAFITHGKT